MSAGAMNAVAPIDRTGAAQAPAALPSPAAIAGHAGGENFPVASRVLRRDQRGHLQALYGFARLADELGDELAGDRLAALDWLERQLDQAYAGAAEHPLLRQLESTLAARRLPRDPFQRLIEANRQDQRVCRYQSWQSLRDYCHLSADPVGELVLHVFGAATPERVSRSNEICTALQLIEHCQDVREDLDRDRVYMPLEDLGRFGLRIEDLASPAPSPAARQLIAFEVARARGLLREGAPLVASLRGRARLAIAAFVGCGHAALDAIAANGYDVFAATPRASKRARLAATARVLAGGRG
jgi:squalene synthase HpnC